MPVTQSVKKSLRKSIKNHQANLDWRSKYKTILKKFMEKLDQKTLADLYSIIDKMGQRNIFHKNKVKRLKAKYARKGKKIEKAVEKKVVAKKKTSKKVVK
jgi:ribosomal protein S20